MPILNGLKFFSPYHLDDFNCLTFHHSFMYYHSVNQRDKLSYFRFYGDIKVGFVQIFTLCFLSYM